MGIGASIGSTPTYVIASSRICGRRSRILWRPRCRRSKSTQSFTPRPASISSCSARATTSRLPPPPREDVHRDAAGTGAPLDHERRDVPLLVRSHATLEELFVHHVEQRVAG